MNTLVALPIVGAAPTTAPAMSPQDSDPAFSAIAAHKKAVAKVEAVNKEGDRLIALADELVGPRTISVLDMRESTSAACGMHPYVDADFIDIDVLVPASENAELNEFYKKKFDRRQAERAAVVGDLDAIMEEPAKALWKASDQLTEVVPTTIGGLLALLKYLSQAHARDDLFAEEGLATLFKSLRKSARMIESELSLA